MFQGNNCVLGFVSLPSQTHLLTSYLSPAMIWAISHSAVFWVSDVRHKKLQESLLVHPA